MLNSVQNHSSIPQLSIITELSIPKTLFNYICPLLTASNSKDFKKQQKPEGCDSLLPVGNLCFSAFFLPESYTFNYLRRKNFEVRSFKNLWMLWISLPSIFISSYLIHTWKVSREISSVPSFIHLLASYSRADDIQQVFTCQRFAIFFAASKKPYMDLGKGLYTDLQRSKMDGPCRRLTTFWVLRCDKSI